MTKVNDKVRPLLHSATGSTKHDRDTLLWQSASVITKFKSYYRVRCNILQNLPLCFFVLYFFFFFFFCKVALFDLLFELHAFKSRSFVNCFCSLLFWFIWALRELYLLLIKDKYLPRSLLTFLTYFLLA